MKFNINDYKGNYAMHTTTESQAKIFCKYLASQGKTWCDGKSYTDKNYFDFYETATTYRFNKDMFASYNYSFLSKDKILEFTDFEWDEEYETAEFISPFEEGKKVWENYFFSEEAALRFIRDMVEIEDKFLLAFRLDLGLEYDNFINKKAKKN